MSFVLESGCKGIAFWLTNQIFSQKSCLKTYHFNICSQLTRIKHLIYLIKYTHAGAWVCAYTYTQITCMAGDAVHGTRILSFWTRILFFWTRIKRIKRILMLGNINLARIKRIIMNNSTGTRNFLRGSHTDLTDLTDFFKCEGGMMRWKEYLDGNVCWKKKGIFVENRWYFYAQKWIFMQNKRRKWINIQNSGCKRNKGFCFLFSKISGISFTIFVNNS